MKKIILLALGAMLTTACADREEKETVEGVGKEIEIYSAIDGKKNTNVSTRWVDITAESIASDGAIVYMIRKNAEGTTAPTDFSSGTWMSAFLTPELKVDFRENKQTYSTDNYHAFFVGALGKGEFAVEDNALTYSLAGSNELLISDVWDGGTFSVPKKTGMNFKHALAKVNLIFRAESEAEYDGVVATFGKLVSAKIIGVSTKIRINSTNLNLDPVNTGKELSFFAMKDGGNALVTDIPAYDNTAVNFHGVYYPDGGTAPIQLVVYTEKYPRGDSNSGIPVSVQLKDAEGNNKGLELGKSHTITLTLKAHNKAIEVTTATIEYWLEDAGFAEGTLEPV